MPFSRYPVIFENKLCTFGMKLSKKITTTVTDSFLIQLLSLTIVSEQKFKTTTRNTMPLSYHSKVNSTQNKNKGDPFFSFLAHGV